MHNIVRLRLSDEFVAATNVECNQWLGIGLKRHVDVKYNSSVLYSSVITLANLELLELILDNHLHLYRKLPERRHGLSRLFGGGVFVVMRSKMTKGGK